LKHISFYGLETIPEIKGGDDLAHIIFRSCEAEGVGLQAGDIVLVTSKIVSKAERSVGRLSDVKPSRRARALARLTKKDPVEVEIILRESNKVTASIPVLKIGEHFPDIFENLATDKEAAERTLRRVPTLLLTQTKHGIVATDAGLDYSNNPPGCYSLLPLDPNASAKKLREGLCQLSGSDLAVILTDTEIALSHIYGSTDISIGYSGIRPVAHRFGAIDRFGREKFGGADVIVDELAGAASLLAGQTSEGIPVVIARGLEYEKGDEVGKHLLFSTDALGKGIRWTVLSTLKLRLTRLIELFS
jgi:coenzyme F420-0:L-glutamate ligase/coenzyme F420-1:gamma-L-glutamate ligase